MIKVIDSLLDKITMYRLVLYYLLFLLGAAVGLSALGYLSYGPLTIIFCASYLSLVCWITNRIFSHVYNVPANTESSLITGLILALIITPTISEPNIIFFTAAGGLAMASKYILVIGKKHIFNPAAMAVALTAIGAGQSASWWVGSAQLLPFVLIGGIFLVRKIQRAQMAWSFLLAASAATFIYSLTGGKSVVISLRQTILHSSLFFLAFVMLTEPQTSPTITNRQRWYGMLAGLLFPPQVHLGTIYSTPELVLVISNVFSYVISPKIKLLPQLVQRVSLAPGIVDFIFSAPRPLAFEPGQYMEWTLPHSNTDSRGDRRYFTLASSPTEDNIRLGVKFYENGSSFKKAMLAMNSKTPIAASQLGGDFTLPKDRSQKLVFIAGGIGITPYRSIIKYLLDKNELRTITLLYSEKTPRQLTYTDIFKSASQKMGLKVVYVLTGRKLTIPNWAKAGPITAKMIKTEIPDYQQRLFYISGPSAMVETTIDILKALDIKNSRIKTDLFPGYS
jgi:ferredoxin-NADP reductase/Na+-translocating ferredoxin:NAD+ oxidoreductase RnfD subunit